MTVGSMAKTRVPISKKSPVMTVTPMKLMRTPALTISKILMRPLPKTMALGGVAMGIIKAQDADRVAGISSIKGLIFMATAMDDKMGKIIWVVAVFEVNSVKNVKVVQMPEIMAMELVPSRI